MVHSPDPHLPTGFLHAAWERRWRSRPRVATMPRDVATVPRDVATAARRCGWHGGMGPRYGRRCVAVVWLVSCTCRSHHSAGTSWTVLVAHAGRGVASAGCTCGSWLSGDTAITGDTLGSWLPQTISSTGDIRGSQLSEDTTSTGDVRGSWLSRATTSDICGSWLSGDTASTGTHVTTLLQGHHQHW